MAIGYLISPVIQVEDINGKPLVGGRIRVYRHGTTIPYITYKDFNGDMNPAEVILDNKGMCVLLADVDGLYDVYCEDRNHVEQWSRLNVGAGQGGGGSSAGIDSIVSSDNSLVIIRTGSSVDITINRDGEASALEAYSGVIASNGNFQFTANPINSVGDDIYLDNGQILCKKKWYHYDATVVLTWNGTPVNLEQEVVITGPDISDRVRFDLSVPHVETVDISGVCEISQDDSPITFAIQSLPSGMTAQITNASIHVIEMGAGGGHTYQPGAGITIEGDTISIDQSTVAMQSDLSGYATDAELAAGLATKQEVIDDLDQIRSGASAGATALQPADVAAVAVSGDYDDLINKPTIPSGSQLVPSATPSDAGEVLTVDSNGDPTWAPVQAPISAGNGVDITNNVVSAKVDGTTVTFNANGELEATAAPQLQSNWNESDPQSVQYIQNKPTIPVLPAMKELVAGTNITITEGSTNVTISATDTTYSAGLGIEISNGAIAVDTASVALKGDVPVIGTITL